MPPLVRQGNIKSLWKPEFIETINFSESSQLSLASNSGQIPRDRYMSGIILQFKGRITNAGANNPTGTMAGGIFNIFDRIKVYGKHRVRRNDDTIIDLSGVNLAELETQYTRVAPVTSGSLATGAAATMDLIANLFIPFVPLMVHPAEQRNHLLDAPMYDTLYLKINSGSYSSVFTGHTANGSFSAYGSATGSATISVYGLYATEPANKFRGFLPGFLSRYQLDSIASTMTTSNSNVRLFNLPKGARLRGMILKTGTLQTGLGALRAYASLSDTLVDNVIVNRGTNRRVWDAVNFSLARQIHAKLKGVSPSTGYMPIDWVNSGGFAELFDTSNLVAGQTGEVDFYLQGNVTGAANQQAELIVEEQVIPPQQVTG